MPWKLRGDGSVEMENGHPVYVHPDGKEVPFDADGALKTIGKLSGEVKLTQKQYREAAEKLTAFSNIGDPEEAIRAIETMKNLDAKKLVDAGQIDLLKNEMSKTFTEKETSLRNQWAQKEQEYQGSLRRKEETLYCLTLNSKFATSPLINEKTNLLPDMAANYFGKHFKIEGDGSDTRIVGYHNGERIPSRQKFGEPADFEEALSVIIDSHPFKDRFLVAGTVGGSGSSGNKTQAGPSVKKVISAGDKKAFGENLEKIAKGEVQVQR